MQQQHAVVAAMHGFDEQGRPGENSPPRLLHVCMCVLMHEPLEKRQHEP